MYIGSTGPTGLRHLIVEIADNCVDEAMAGFATRINVTIAQDGHITVKDNGRGIPIDIHPQTGKTALESVVNLRISVSKPLFPSFRRKRETRIR